jgi:hypothetical protein
MAQASLGTFCFSFLFWTLCYHILPLPFLNLDKCLAMLQIAFVGNSLFATVPKKIQ